MGDIEAARALAYVAHTIEFETEGHRKIFSLTHVIVVAEPIASQTYGFEWTLSGRCGTRF